MPHLMTFHCPELDASYEVIYRELADALELSLEDTAHRFAPDDAVALVRYHRRQASRRGIQLQLAEWLGLDASPVFAAVSEDGARILLEALQAQGRESAAKRPTTVTLTTRVAQPAEQLIDALEDAMSR